MCLRRYTRGSVWPGQNQSEVRELVEARPQRAVGLGLFAEEQYKVLSVSAIT